MSNGVDAIGQIVQINTSRGGVPKLPLRDAEIGDRGVTGDWQNDRKHHGSPDQALCLYSLERILSLQLEGHPIYPGSTGENITTAGIDFDAMVPATRLRLGHDVEIEITDYAHPCKTIIDSFAGGDFKRISQKLHPGWSRVYARIITPGRLRIGDRIVIIG